MYDYAYCPRHLLDSTRCIVPGCKRERLGDDLTCWRHLLTDARIEDDDTQPVNVEEIARGRAR